MPNTLRNLSRGLTFDAMESIRSAVSAYLPDLWERDVYLESIPLDALVFSTWQSPYVSIEEYREKRCKFDHETNEWLEHYVRKMAEAKVLQPIIVSITDSGIALIDGVHRTSALLMFTDRTHIDAWVIQ